jgi:hypothetical protein
LGKFFLTREKYREESWAFYFCVFILFFWHYTHFTGIELKWNVGVLGCFWGYG